MKITDVEAFILKSPYENGLPEGRDEAHGVKHCLLLKVSTDEGLVGWSDVETAPHVADGVVNAPASGAGVFEGVRSLLIGEDPFEVERLWDKVYRGTIYYGRRGVAIQVLSGFDIACHDLMGKATGRPLHKLLGGARRDRVRAYASTLFRSTPDAMKRACEFYRSRGSPTCSRRRACTSTRCCRALSSSNTTSATIRCCAKSFAIPRGWIPMGSSPCHWDRAWASKSMKRRSAGSA